MTLMLLPRPGVAVNPRVVLRYAAIVAAALACAQLHVRRPPTLCVLRAVTGVPCPLCGLSTSVEETVRLHLRSAVEGNPFGLVLVAVAVALLALRPRRLSLPLPALYLALCASWLFELHRFSII